MFRKKYSEDLFNHWHDFEVMYRDLDTNNHVNNAVFNTYFEEARINFITTIPEFIKGLEEKKSFVLVKCTIEYLKPIIYPSKLLIGSGCTEVGNSSIEALQAIYDADSHQLLSVALTKGVWFNLNTQRPERIPEIADIDAYMVEKD